MLLSRGVETHHVPGFEYALLFVADDRRGHTAVSLPGRLLFDNRMRPVL
jgi:hypothetical protein